MDLINQAHFIDIKGLNLNSEIHIYVLGKGFRIIISKTLSLIDIKKIVLYGLNTTSSCFKAIL